MWKQLLETEVIEVALKNSETKSNIFVCKSGTVEEHSGNPSE